MKTVLITGIAGLIGSRLAKYLTENNYHVIGIDNLSGGLISNVPKDCIFYNIDCCDNLDEIFKRYEIDTVYHFAAYAAECLSPFIRTYNYRNNLIATSNIVNYCINYNVRKLIFTSSIAVYGHTTPDSPYNESMPVKPEDPYGVAKYACELDIEIAHKQHGLEYCIVRPHNVFGVGQNIWDKYRNVLGIWMRQYINGEPITIFGDGSQKRYFTSIDDILEPLQLMMEKCDHKIYNLGSDRPISILDVAKTLSDIVGNEFGNLRINFVEGRHEAQFIPITHDNLISDFGESDSDFRSSVKEMWEWAKVQPASNVKIFDYEVSKGMYEIWK